MNYKTISVSAAVLSLSLSACSLPAGAPSVTQHDLGGAFALGSVRTSVPLRSIQVGAQPLVAGNAMQYREMSQPTRRGVYALNRWAASPAAMVEAALVRQLAPDGSSRCRLQFSLGEFIIEVGTDGSSRAVLAADASLLQDGTGVGASATPGRVLRQGFDIAVPMREITPAAGAMALREAVRKLAESSATWLSGEPGRQCAI